MFPICQDTVIRVPLGRLVLTFGNPLVAEKSLQGMPIFILFDLLGFLIGHGGLLVSRRTFVESDDLVHHFRKQLLILLRCLIIIYLILLSTSVMYLNSRLLLHISVYFFILEFLLLNNLERPNSLGRIFAIPPLKVIRHRRDRHIRRILHLIFIDIGSKPIVVFVVLNIGRVEVVLDSLADIPLDELGVGLGVAQVGVGFVTKVWR